MIRHTTNKELETLMIQYNSQIDILKEKLLNGASWDSLAEHRNKIMQLALSIRNSFVATTKTVRLIS